MPDFQASLVDPTSNEIDVTLDVDCSVVTLEDNSNYTTSTEDGHLDGDFANFRQLEVTSPDGSTYDFDAQGLIPNSGSWNQGVLRTNNLDRTLSATDNDGIYTLTLYTIPDFNPTAVYNHTATNPKAVHYLQKIWRTLQTTPAGNTPALGSVFWEEITREDLSSKYCTTATFSLTCRELNACLERITTEAVCVVQAETCDDDLLCGNHTFLESLKLKTLLDGVGYASDQGNFTEAKNLINAAKNICNC